MEDSYDAERAIKGVSGMKLKDREIRVEVSCDYFNIINHSIE